MKKFKMVLIIFSLFSASFCFSQTGKLLIYDSGNLGISKFQSFKINNIPQRQIYVQLNCSHTPPPPNSTGRFLRFNRTYFYWYTPYNSFLNNHWAYEGFNGFWSCNPVGHFVVSPHDSDIIIKHSDEVLSDCCGLFQINKVTWNSGASIDNSVEVPEYSGYCGMDIDTTTSAIAGESVYFYGYKMLHSFGNTVNAIIKVRNYLSFFFDQEITDTIPSLKKFSEGGFLKINPFNRNYIFVVADNMMLSTTSGTNFFSINLPPVKKLIFSERDRKVYGYTNTKLYSSSNNGLIWDSVSLTFPFNVMESNPDSAHILYAGNENGLYVSRNRGMNWSLYNNSFTTSRNVIGISKDNFSGDTLFVCTDREVYIVWSSFVVDISNLLSKTPDRYSLYQNYPNPFNPVTVIRYSIIENSLVTLKVYDVLGNEIATLINEQKSAGSYNYQLSTANYQLSSGIYFYKLEAGSFVETKRMILLK